jgi:hypothetical protein
MNWKEKMKESDFIVHNFTFAYMLHEHEIRI